MEKTLLRVSEKLRSTSIWHLLAIGLIIRFVLAPFTVSDDVKTWIWVCVVAYEVGANPFYFFYGYGSLWTITLLAIYPLYLVLPSFWQHEAMLFTILKTPMVFCDLAIGFVIYQMIYDSTNSEKKAILGASIWVLNPLAIFFGEVFGMFDSIPVLFTLLSAYALTRRRYCLGAALLAVAAGYKLYPVFLLPVYLAISLRTKGFAEAVKSILSFGAAFVAVFSPLLAVGRVFAASAEAAVRWPTQLSIWWYLYRVQPFARLGLDQSMCWQATLLALMGVSMLLMFRRGWFDSLDAGLVSRCFGVAALVVIVSYTWIACQSALWPLPFVIIALCTTQAFTSTPVHAMWLFPLLFPARANSFQPYRYIAPFFSSVITSGLWPLKTSGKVSVALGLNSVFAFIAMLLCMLKPSKSASERAPGRTSMLPKALALLIAVYLTLYVYSPWVRDDLWNPIWAPVEAPGMWVCLAASAVLLCALAWELVKKGFAKFSKGSLLLTGFLAVTACAVAFQPGLSASLATYLFAALLVASALAALRGYRWGAVYAGFLAIAISNYLAIRQGFSDLAQQVFTLGLLLPLFAVALFVERDLGR